MHGGSRLAGWALSGVAVAMLQGCVSLDAHRRLQAQHRTVLAEKEHMGQELFDSRSVNDSLRARISSLEREMGVKDELVGNLRGENELLDEMRRLTQTELEDAANRQTLGPITIATPKLPKMLDSALKTFSSEHPTQVTYDAARGTVKWNADLLFAAGSDVVRDSSKESLRGFTEIIRSPAAAAFEAVVVGHTDNQPIVRSKANHPTNWHLAAHRAIAVAGVLLEYGYLPDRTGVMGYGEHRPIADNGNEQGRSQNRRVEVYLVPNGTLVGASADASRAGEGDALAARLTR